VQTETLSVKARPLASGYVKAKTGDNTTDATYTAWYNAVYQPNAAVRYRLKWFEGGVR
jgi:hypothetical protein